MKWEEDGIDIPFMCQQCEDPLCAQVCPMNAIEKDESGVIRTSYEKCIGCRMCVIVCPMGGATFDPVEKKVIWCDLCKGDPFCVKICPPGAISFVKPVTVGLARKRQGLQNLLNTIKMGTDEGIGDSP
jgi:Fe-S-cluster-containing hydrogenase component 2